MRICSLRKMNIGWVVLTMGDRHDELRAAVDSILRQTVPSPVLIHVNGAPIGPVEAEFAADPNVRVQGTAANVGAPQGRNEAIKNLGPHMHIIGCLDDDAVLLDRATNERLCQEFSDDDVAAVTLRIVDENGLTSRRHNPRVGTGSSETSGEVATFLAGACAFRHRSFNFVGGYWGLLVYGHEELDLAWRFIDDGQSIRYLADLRVFHPRTEIARHAEGWRLTGRNRVLVARRGLPIPLVWAHSVAWLLVGLGRAPKNCRRPYASGWLSGWRISVERRPMRWSTVGRLTRLGRPPIL